LDAEQPGLVGSHVGIRNDGLAWVGSHALAPVEEVPVTHPASLLRPIRRLTEGSGSPLGAPRGEAGRRAGAGEGAGFGYTVRRSIRSSSRRSWPRSRVIRASSSSQSGERLG